MTKLQWWMRAVGLLYVLVFIAAVIVKAPISAEGPPGILAAAAAGDPLAKFVVDTWVTFGLYIGAVGIGLLIVSARRDLTTAPVWIVACMELAGIVADANKLARGYESGPPLVWMAIHAVVIVTGVWLARAATRIPASQ